jgi:hypothetical protein
MWILEHHENVFFLQEENKTKDFPFTIGIQTPLQIGWLLEFGCRNPTLAKCGGEAQHLEKVRIGVLRDSQMFRARQQGPKHLALGCSWCHWKGFEA